MPIRRRQLSITNMNSVPPNGGWGWMVVIGAALINMVNQAMFSVFGLIYGEKLKELSNGTTVGFALVMSINIMFTNVAGLAVGPLMKVTNIRIISIVGVIFSGSGVICCAFANETWHILVGYGIVTGTGLGLLQSLTFLAINAYFTTRKSLAVGLAMAGTSIGQMLLPLLVGYLLEHYQFYGTCITVGSISYSGVIGAIFFKPIQCYNRRPNTGQDRNRLNVEIDNEITNNNANEPEDDNFATNTQNGTQETTHLTETRVVVASEYQGSAINVINKNNIQRTSTLQTIVNVLEKIITLLNLSLLKNMTFMHYLLGLSFAYMSSVSFTSFFPILLREELQISVKKSTYCMTVLSSADILGRVTISLVAKKLGLGTKGAFMFGCVMLGITRSCLIELTEYNHILVGSFIAGYFRAPAVIFQNLVISDYIRDERLASALGLNMVMKGITVLICGQFLAVLRDQYNLYVVVHFLDAVLFGVVIFWLLHRLNRYYKRCNLIAYNI